MNKLNIKVFGELFIQGRGEVGDYPRDIYSLINQNKSMDCQQLKVNRLPVLGQLRAI